MTKRLFLLFVVASIGGLATGCDPAPPKDNSHVVAPPPPPRPGGPAAK